MLLTGLYHYLTYGGDLPGHAADPFAWPQVVDGRSMANRNEARRQIRDLVGSAVFETKIPQNQGKLATAITLRQVAGNTDLPLIGETGLQEVIVELQVWARGAHASHRARVIGRICQLALSNYFGWLDWSRECWAQSIVIERPGEEQAAPVDGSDDWPINWSMDLNCAWSAAAAIYPDETLQAIITTRAGSGGALIVSGTASHVATGRPLETVTFAVRDSQGGNTLKTWTGGPNAAVTGVAGVTGLVIEAAVSGLPASGWIDLTIVDKHGDTSAAGVSYEQ